MKNNEYFWTTILNYIQKKYNKIKADKDVQKIYDEYKYGYSSSFNQETINRLQEYNSNQYEPYLATGQSSYFNNKIANYGLNNLKLDPDDVARAKFIANCFGKETKYTENNIPILYVTMLGTTEFNYATQAFPAGIFEDVFQLSVTHELPIMPKVGESEEDFYLRVLEFQTEKLETFNKEKKDEVLLRGKELISKFCTSKNRVYLIRLSDVLNIKASFGDIYGLRDGIFNEEQAKQRIDSLAYFVDLLKAYHIDVETKWGLFSDHNMNSEYGIALYGAIPMNSIKYIEVERGYSMLQKRAIDLGYKTGDLIPSDYKEHKANDAEAVDNVHKSR